MYPVTNDYKNKIKENNRIFKADIRINHSLGELNLTDKDIVLGSLICNESSQAGEEFTIGGTVASDLSVSILNKPEYDNINFMGARITATISLLIREGADAHFIQPSQPSRFSDSGDLWEEVPLGKFNIDEVKRLRNIIELKAIDNMANLDIPYSLSKLSYPANLYQIYVNICNVADVQVGTFDFANKDYVVQERPGGDLTLRDVLGYVAELSGTFAKFNRNGGLELKWYQSTGIELGPKNRFNFKPSDDVVQIKGIMVTVNDTTYLAGSEDYAIDLTDNPLLQGNYETVLPNIFNNVKDTVFTPYTSDWQGNPALQAGDMITQIDRDGKIYNTLITKSTYKYRGRSVLEAKGLPDISKGFKGSTDKRIAQIKKVVVEEVGDKLTTLEQAQLNATELMANMLGGYVIEDKVNGILYIADNPVLANAMKIWKWGINGFGYSSNGGLTWTTAVTADGSIVAELVSAGIVTADMIVAGILQSKDGSFSLNLDNGTFSFTNGIVQFTPTGLRVAHNVAKDQYSEIRYDGYVRKYQYGEDYYLNGIHLATYTFDKSYTTTKPTAVRVSLPQSFKGRGSKLKVFLTQTGMSMVIGNMNTSGTVTNISTHLDTVLRVVASNFDATTPYVDVESYITQQWKSSGGLSGTDYGKLDFMIMVVGQ